MPLVTSGGRYADESNLEVNRWGVPVKFLLQGGGSEKDVILPVNALAWNNKLSSSRQSKWSHLNKISTMSVDQSSNMNKSSSQRSAASSGSSPGASTKSSGTSMQNVPTSNANGSNSSWAQVAGKGIPSGGVPSEEDKLQTIKEALLSTEGWGGENVNQDSSWDLPPSPEPNKDHSSHPKAPVNDGCELWKNVKAGEQGSSTPNASAWNQTPASSSDKSSDGTNSWFAYPPISQQWRPHPPEPQNNMLMGPKTNPSIEESPFDWQPPKNPITTSVASVPNMPLPSTGGTIPNPNSYSMGPFPHVDAQNLAGQSAGSGMNVSHKMSNAHVLLQEQSNSNNPKENRAPGWDGMVSMPKDGPSNNWGGVGSGPQPMNHHKWIGLPNHSLPERHMVTSSNQAPIMAPPLPHGLIKPDQIMWSQINPGGDYHHDMMAGGNWGNNSMTGGPPNYKSNSSIPEPNNEDFDLSAIDPLKKMNQDSSQPLPAFISQIQLAVQAGFLNAQILQQPLAPNSLVLLNQMLSSVALLHKLLQQQSILQPQIHVNKNAHQQFVQHNIHINKTKQQIQHLQTQINNNQDMYMKHQSHQAMRSSQPGLPQNMMGSGNPQQDYKSNVPDHFLLNFNQMNIRDSNPSGPVRSQMPGDAVKWKQGVGNHYSSSMLRDHPKHNLKPHANQLSYFGSDSSWPQNKSIDHGWSPHMVNRHGVPTPPSNDHSGSSHELPWSSGHHQPVQPFDLDIKPFEPGKPWMMKNLEDGFEFGAAAATSRPSLGLHDNDVLGTKVSSNPDVSATLSSLPLNSSTWSFNPSSQSSNANNSDAKVVAQNLRAKESWNEGPRQSDLWPPQGNKNGGGAASGSSKSNSQSWGAIGRSTSWAGPSRTTTSSALSQNPSWSSASTWLILKNLTPEIDGSTLKTLCMQHGPLVTFHLYLSHGFALVNYGTHEEAMNAQSSLNNCLLSNTTILAEFAADFEVNQLLGSGQGRGTTPTSTSSSKPDGPWASGSSLWNAGGGNSSLWSGSSYADGEQQRSTPSSLKSYLPDGLLNSETI